MVIFILEVLRNLVSAKIGIELRIIRIRFCFIDV